MNKLLEAALEYANRFQWPVFPCAPRGKRPITKHGLKDATTNADTIRAWWRRRPDANVAIGTGVVIDVLDVDGDEGLEELSRLIGGDDVELPPGPTVWTPNGGIHLYVAATGLGNRARFRPGLDWRGAGGYVIGPPSIGANDVRYRWFTGPEIDPGRAPGWLTDLIAATGYWGVPTPRPPRPPQPTTGRYADAALDDEIARVRTAPVGTRNHSLNNAAFALGQLVGAGLLDAKGVIDQLLRAALATGLSDAEARATIRSGLKAGVAQPRQVKR